MTDLATVVVSWNTVDLLDECLASIEASVPPGTSHEVVLVDNASTDGSAEHVRRHWPSVTVVESPTNVGFCRANNLAAQHTGARHLLLVNTDARLAPDTVTAMLRELDDPEVAVVGPRLVYGDGAWQRWTAGRLPRPASMAVWLSGLDRLLPRRFGRSGLYLADDVREPCDAEWVSSAVMLVRREAFDAVGGFDDAIFVYMDDVDLCHRVAQQGWRVRYAAGTTAVHFMGSSTRRVTGRASPEALRALNRWYARHHGAAGALVLRGLEATGFAARAGVLAVAAVLRRPGARDRLGATTTHLRLALEGIDA